MRFSEDVLFRVGIFLLACFGFWVAYHIFKHKRPDKTPLVCPLQFDCKTVVHSDYSKFFGIPVEILGMIYYAFIAFSYLVLIFLPHALPAAVVAVLAILSLIAFLFSAYLIGVQLFILKKGCFWCFISAFICIGIFSLTVSAYDLGALWASVFS